MLTVNDKDKEKRPLTDIVREVNRNQRRRDFQEWRIDPIELNATKLWRKKKKQQKNMLNLNRKYPQFWVYKMHVSLKINK